MKTVLFSAEARAKILTGVQAITRAVAATLGPKGRNVLIADSEIRDSQIINFPVRATKDGVTVARAFSLNDPIENVGVNLIKSAAQKTVGDAGDATTTTCVLAAAMVEKGVKVINSGFNPIEVKKGMDAAMQEVVDKLKQYSTPIAGNAERIKQVATVSANNDESIGSLIAEAYTKVGDEGVINIEDSKTGETKLRIEEGFTFESGYISTHFIRDYAKGTCVFPDLPAVPTSPLLLLHDRPITKTSQIQPIMAKAHQAQRPLVIIAPDIDSEALAYLLINNSKGTLPSCAIKAPFVADKLDEAMEDMAALTGATYLSNLKGIKLENAELHHLGEAEKIVVKKDSTTIIGGRKDEKKKNETIDRLRKAKEQAQTDEEKYAIEERLARLNGAVAVIEVGGNTDIEQKEKKDRIEDAVLSVKAAIAEGFIVGGGTALARIGNDMKPGQYAGDFRAGYEIVTDSLFEPFFKICDNAGVQSADMLVEVLEQGEFNVGYNAHTEQMENLVNTGIIDATKVVKSALINATSVAGTLLTAECLIVENF